MNDVPSTPTWSSSAEAELAKVIENARESGRLSQHDLVRALPHVEMTAEVLAEIYRRCEAAGVVLEEVDDLDLNVPAAWRSTGEASTWSTRRTKTPRSCCSPPTGSTCGGCPQPCAAAPGRTPPRPPSGAAAAARPTPSACTCARSAAAAARGAEEVALASASRRASRRRCSSPSSTPRSPRRPRRRRGRPPPGPGRRRRRRQEQPHPGQPAARRPIAKRYVGAAWAAST